MEKKVIIRSLVGSPAKIAATVAVIVLLLFLGYSWLLKSPATPPTEPSEVPIEQTVIPTLDGPTDAATEEQAKGANKEMPSQLEPTDDTASLPPAVTSETASVGVAESGERVVITSDVVDALLDDNTEVAVTNAAEIQNVVTPKVDVVDNVQKPQTPITFSFAREELNALPVNHYTLQIAAMTELKDVQLFLNQHTFDKPVRIYPTLRGDEKWYIVTYDVYLSIQTARDAAEALPEDIQSLGPWPKSLSQVQREITRWKE